MKQDLRKFEGNLPLLDNEFTVSELKLYAKLIYHSKINYSAFTNNNIAQWIVQGKMPEVYGGHKLTQRYMSGIRILTIEGLSRSDVEFAKVLNGEELPRIDQTKKKRGRRTRLYYQLARQPLPKGESFLPDNWKDIGITPTQLKLTKKKKKK